MTSGEGSLIAPPYEHLWSAPGSSHVAASLDGVAVWAADARGDIVCYKPDGQLSWRCAGTFGALEVDEGVLWSTSGDAVLRLRGLRLDGGAGVKDEVCEFRLCTLVPAVHGWIGFSRDQVALVSLDSAKPIWVAGPHAKLSREAVHSGGSVLTGLNGEAVALSLSDGTQRWSSDLLSLGDRLDPFGSWPATADDYLVVTTERGTTAFDVATGALQWWSTLRGRYTLIDGRVHMIDRGTDYCVLDLRDGRELMRAPIATLVREEWGIDDMEPGSWPLVERSRLWLGDHRGRVFVFDALTAKPLWCDPRTEVPGYFAARPRLAGDRLYMATFGSPKQPGALHCYLTTR